MSRNSSPSRPVPSVPTTYGSRSSPRRSVPNASARCSTRRSVPPLAAMSPGHWRHWTMRHTAGTARRSSRRLARGALIAPPEDNARFYFESARALAPGDAGVQQSMQELITRLQSEAHQALVAKNAEQADIWIAAAADLG